MASDLPNEFDVIVLGTGLPESILSAAFSRIGLKVLHIDRNDYYSGSWASFNLQGIEKWKCRQESAACYTTELTEEKLNEFLKTGEKLLQLPEFFPTIYGAKTGFHLWERPQDDPADSETAAEPDQGPAVEEAAVVKSTGEETALEAQPLDRCQQQSDSGHASGNVEDVGSASVAEGQFDSASEDDGNSEAKGQTSDAASTSPESSGKLPDHQLAKEQKQWFADDLQKEWRRFNFDIAPKLLYCAGSMVELLIASDVAKYCEFRTVSRVLTVRDNKLEKVPCSRADVFASKAISLPEKRLLMKFLTFAAEYDQHEEEYKDFLGRPFVEFLSSKKLSPKIQHFILHSIAMATQTTTTEEGLASTRKFLRSLGRYGNTAFLFPLYGSGELPQAFCRLSAVFGGCYVLTLSVSHIIINEDNRCTAVVTSAGQRIDCKYLIADPSYVPGSFYTSDQKRQISRAVFITDKSMFPSEEEELSLLQFPLKDETLAPTTFLELPPSAMVSPRSLYVVHASRPALDVPFSDLHHEVNKLFVKDQDDPETKDDEGREKPRILWSLYFAQQDLSCLKPTENMPPNVFVVTGPGLEFDMDRCVGEAQNIFKQVCPEEEFLPKPPHPDDIIYVDDEETPAAGAGSGDWTDKADSGETQDIEEVGQSQRPSGTDTEEQSPTQASELESTEKSAPVSDCGVRGNGDTQSETSTEKETKPVEGSQ